MNSDTGIAMTEFAAFSALSRAVASVARAAAPCVLGVEWGGRHHISGVLWRAGILVTSEQSLPDADAFSAVLPGGARVAATLAGRDASTNVAVLRLEATAAALPCSEPQAVGALVLAIGSDGAGGITSRMGSIEALGPPWESQRGGRIDRLVRLGVDLGPPAEGGAVVDAEGGLLGMSTFGPRGSVLVIPASTVARVLDQLLQQGRIARGWLGVGLHPVALPRDLVDRTGVSGGLMVVNLAEGAPAATALLPGDILLEIAGTPVASPRAVAAALGPDTVGKVLALKLLRGGAVATADVTIAARPA
jgi:S1-C subfamily serine protease